MSALAIVPPEPLDTSTLSAESTLLIRDAEAIEITDDASYRAACEFGKGVKALQKRIKEFFAPSKRRWDEGHSAECLREREQLTPTERAEEIIKTKVLAWQRSEREREQEEQARRDKAALVLETERRLQNAIALEAEGDVAAATEILEAPINDFALPAPRPRSSANVAGVSTPKRWTFDEHRVDVAAVIRHIAGLAPDAKLAHPALVQLLTLDTVATRRRIVADGEHFNVPGIRAYEAEGVSFGSK